MNLVVRGRLDKKSWRRDACSGKERRVPPSLSIQTWHFWSDAWPSHRPGPSANVPVQPAQDQEGKFGTRDAISVCMQASPVRKPSVILVGLISGY